MDVYLLDWANLLLRWLHVMIAISWIGSSFYFIWLDNHLERPQPGDRTAGGADGELWAVHGGGFYHPVKYMVAPAHLPTKLHWFYWDAYVTWMSGFALFVVLYLWNADAYLIDRQVRDWPTSYAIGAALAYLGLGWVAYDLICRTVGHRESGDRMVAILVAVYTAAAAWIACQLFAGRAAFLLTGAMIATIMSANVLMVIIPGQKKVVAAMRAGETPDPIHGMRGKQRSVHNSYFTLPVLFAMLSNHYSLAYGAPSNWLVLILILLSGALIRHFFILTHKGIRNWGYAAAAVLLLAGVAAWIAPRPEATAARAGAAPAVAANRFDQIQEIIRRRCEMCHNAQLASKNVQLHTPAFIVRNGQLIYQQAVLHRNMPLNNSTGITEEERAILGAWAREGAGP